MRTVPDCLIERVSTAIEGNPNRSKTAITQLVKGTKQDVLRAIDTLIASGHVQSTPGERAPTLLSVRPYRSGNDPTTGSLWDLSGLAAAQPVHFHPLTPTMFVMVFSQRWHTTTPSGTDPGAFTSHSEDTTPGWVLVRAPAGGASTIGGSYALPTNIPGTRTLVAAASRATDYLYTLCTDGSVAVLTMIGTSSVNSFTIIGEERPLRIGEIGWILFAFRHATMLATPVTSVTPARRATFPTRSHGSGCATSCHCVRGVRGREAEVAGQFGRREHVRRGGHPGRLLAFARLGLLERARPKEPRDPV